jgi:signal transduction histidine kinase
MTRPSTPPHSTRDRLHRASWLLWGITFVLLFSLTATVPALFVPLLAMAGGEHRQWLRDAYPVVVALVGLVVLFMLYTVLKQAELNRTREALEAEERERSSVSARLSELSALFQVSTTLHMQLRLEVILEIIVRRVVTTLGAQQASIMILNPETGVLETRASYGLEAEFSRGAQRRMGEGIAGWVAMRREAVLLGRRAAGTELGAHYKANRNITSAVSMPLMLGERVLGVLNVNRINHDESFGERHVEMLRTFAEHVAAVIDRAATLERLGDRARRLEADNEKLADLNRLKDVFLATATHELKSPIASVLAYADLLEDEDARLSREQAREFVTRLRAEAQRLLALVDDILDLSRLETGKLHLKSRDVSPAELVKGAVETSRPLARKLGVEVVNEVGGELGALALDEVRLRQAVGILLSGALHRSSKGGRVHLRAKDDHGYCRIEVADDGPAIPPAQATHLFELFQSGVPEGAEATRAGVGISLHLVRRLVEMHGGHVGVDSGVREGNVFWIRLPAPAAHVAGEAERQAA